MSSNLIYSTFVQTYLYIKRHSVTGKLYFGKTVKDPEKYSGSGRHWKSHIKKHGIEYVETLWYCLFLDQESLTEFALNFSRQNNIVESEDWLNLQEENGLDGNVLGFKHSEETKLKMRKASRPSKELVSTETRSKISQSKIGKKRSPFSEETKAKMRAAKLGKTCSEETKAKMRESALRRAT